MLSFATHEAAMAFSVTAESLSATSAPKFLIGPITEGSQGMLYGPPGVGKTLLAMELALGLASGTSRLHHPDTISAPQWKAPVPACVLYVAGEMHNAELAKRIELGGKRNLGNRFHLLSNAMLWHSQKTVINIADKAGQKLVMDEALDVGAALVILDNLDTLTKDIDENSKTEVSVINEWLLTFRYSNIAVLQVHHESKAGSPRGSGVRSTPLDYQIRLANAALDLPDDAPPGANFNVSFSKVREDLGRTVRPFNMRLEDSLWAFSTPVQSKLEHLLAFMDAVGEWSPHDIAKELAVSLSYVYQLREKAIDAGRWPWKKGGKGGKASIN